MTWRIAAKSATSGTMIAWMGMAARGALLLAFHACRFRLARSREVGLPQVRAVPV